MLGFDFTANSLESEVAGSDQLTKLKMAEIRPSVDTVMQRNKTSGQDSPNVMFATTTLLGLLPYNDRPTGGLNTSQVRKTPNTLRKD